MFDTLILEAIEQPIVSQDPAEKQEISQTTGKQKPRSQRRNHPGRTPIPEHLERVEIILDVPEKDKICQQTGKPLKEIGWEVSEKLEYRRGKLIVNVYKRPK
jgi:transposase